MQIRLLPRARLGALIDALIARGYRVIGPTLEDGVIAYRPLSSEADLPVGYTDRQEAGRYRLERRNDAAVFGYAVGPHSHKELFLRPEETLVTIRRNKDSWDVQPAPARGERLALLGARSCDLAAIAIQDRVLAAGSFADRHYAARRSDVFVVAVECGVAGGTCFCASMGTGPDARSGFDLALTELLSGEHRFVVRIGSDAGAALADELALAVASDADVAAARAVVERTAGSMGRTLDTRDLPARLLAHPEHPRWDDVATRCLACTSCTMVCPTCFCTDVEDTTDLRGEIADRVRRWDSCFTLDFSHLHGGAVRSSVRARYRQWLTHKLASWWEQFDTSGCVGCGRCITWCPAAIDITEEATAIARRSE
jgi:ferredoxin